MADGFTMSVDTRELEEALKQLPERIARRCFRKALQAGGDVILAAMVDLAPERTDEPTPNGDSLPPGILKADLHAQVELNPTGGTVRVGPTAVAGYVARFQNNGWMLTRGRGKKAHQIRAIAGKHFMEAAFDEAGPTALDVFCQTLGDEIVNASSGTDSPSGDTSPEGEE